MPCPGPHLIPAIVMSWLPWPTEMQSSPVPILELEMVTAVLRSRWMPSVLGLSAGATILMPLALKFALLSSAMWKNLLFTDVMSFILLWFVARNAKDYNEEIAKVSLLSLKIYRGKS